MKIEKELSYVSFMGIKNFIWQSVCWERQAVADMAKTVNYRHDFTGMAETIIKEQAKRDGAIRILKEFGIDVEIYENDIGLFYKGEPLEPSSYAIS